MIGHAEALAAARRTEHRPCSRAARQAADRIEGEALSEEQRSAVAALVLTCGIAEALPTGVSAAYAAAVDRLTEAPQPRDGSHR